MKTRGSVETFALVALIVFISLPGTPGADHPTPERLIEGKYVAILTPYYEGDFAKLAVIFRDAGTGQNLETLKLHVVIKDANSHTVFERNVNAINGRAEIPYIFPPDEYYLLSVAFEKADEPGRVYGPVEWEVQVPARKGIEAFYAPLAFLLVVALLAAWKLWRVKQ